VVRRVTYWSGVVQVRAVEAVAVERAAVERAAVELRGWSGLDVVEDSPARERSLGSGEEHGEPCTATHETIVPRLRAQVDSVRIDAARRDRGDHRRPPADAARARGDASSQRRADPAVAARRDVAATVASARSRRVVRLMRW
ncbi:MAG: hypothetical protein KF795_32460, partial [Labilithrix sp.]|nr:hypothetical protein [Labilithrix sp.]